MNFEFLKLDKKYLKDADFMQLPDATKWHFIGMYILAGEAKSEGIIAQNNKPLSIKNISYLLDCPIDELTKSISLLLGIDIIRFENDSYIITRFMDEQGPVKETAKEYWAKKQREYRSKIKDKKNTTINSNNNIKDKELYKEEELEEDKEYKNKRKNNNKNKIEDKEEEDVNDMSRTFDNAEESEPTNNEIFDFVSNKFTNEETFTYADRIKILALSDKYIEYFFRSYNANDVRKYIQEGKSFDDCRMFKKD